MNTQAHPLRHYAFRSANLGQEEPMDALPNFDPN